MAVEFHFMFQETNRQFQNKSQGSENGGFGARASAAGADRAGGKRLLKLSSSSVLLVPGLMYLKGAINADSIPTFSAGETRDTKSQQQGSGSNVFIVFIDYSLGSALA